MIASEMNTVAMSRCFGILLCGVVPVSADVPSPDTTSPNVYSFSSSVYYAEATDTNATINVDFSPGNRSWIGSVGFTTQDGTAVAGENYTTNSGTLWWSGPSLKSFPVALRPPNSGADKTVKLFLQKTESNCILTRVEATLIIRAEPPKLAIAPGAGTAIRLSWPAAYTNYVLETTTGGFNSGEWTAINNTPSLANGQCEMEVAADQPCRLFRLRRQ
jgi:hypothetical protein